jgi:predicted kinase
MDKELILLIGNIASGKSTKAKELAKQGYTIISRDAIRYMIGAGEYIFNPDLEPTIKKATHELLKKFLEDDVRVVYDETNVNQALRSSTIEIAKEYGYKVIAVVMPRLSKRKSVNRRVKDPHGSDDRDIWNMVWTNFDSIYEEPTIEEGIDEIIQL